MNVILSKRQAAEMARAPKTGGWRLMGFVPLGNGEELGAWYWRGGVDVLSTTELIENEGVGHDTLEWHISVSVSEMAGLSIDGRPAYRRVAASDEILTAVRRDFEMEAAFEDNHNPGVVRNLFLAVNPSDRRPACSCEANEKPHQEGCRVWREEPKS